MKKGIKKLIILVLIFIAVIGMFIWMNRGKKEKIEYMVMSEASLPVVRLRFGEHLINELCGYREKMDGRTVREGTYPLGEDLVISVQISSTGKEVVAIGYEVRSLDELQQVLDLGGVQRIMFDNFTPEVTRKAVEMVAGRYETESSGGITFDTLRDYALCGVDFISVGALTHSVKGLDMSFKAVQ